MALGGGMHSLHGGGLTFGPVGIAVTTLSGLSLVALSLLGLVRWWQRWRVSLFAEIRKTSLRKSGQIPNS